MAITIPGLDTLAFWLFELVLLVVSAIFIWIGAKVAEVEKGSLMRSIGIAVILAILVPLLLIPFASMAIIPIVLSIVITLAVIKAAFATSWRKSLVAWVFSIIAQFIAIAALVFVFGLFMLA